MEEKQLLDDVFLDEIESLEKLLRQNQFDVDFLGQDNQMGLKEWFRFLQVTKSCSTAFSTSVEIKLKPKVWFDYYLKKKCSSNNKNKRIFFNTISSSCLKYITKLVTWLNFNSTYFVIFT